MGSRGKMRPSGTQDRPNWHTTWSCSLPRDPLFTGSCDRPVMSAMATDGVKFEAERDRSVEAASCRFSSRTATGSIVCRTVGDSTPQGEGHGSTGGGSTRRRPDRLLKRSSFVRKWHGNRGGVLSICLFICSIERIINLNILSF
jgi:hypothetical protein